ncbi:MAG: protein-L-isoaspartate(D-aspartate) O-methyltransferase [Bacteroidetes bacterium]|nr:MAG: protein-L-isoaspartate(D-aspartate) O-methyltransferase [Bacteroidota bacterium]
MIDSYRHQGLRRKLVQTIKSKGISDDRVLSAMEKIPRHYFMDSSFTEIAYQDKPFPIGLGQTISQPYTVAFQTELLKVEPGQKVLEIGTGSGYQACVLVEMGARVFSVERHRELHRKSKALLGQMGYHPKLFYGDGYEGLPAYAPFDKILVTAGASETPPALLQQLNIGGMLVIPLGKGSNQVMTRFTKISENDFEKEEFGHFRFVPLLGKKT